MSMACRDAGASSAQGAEPGTLERNAFWKMPAGRTWRLSMVSLFIFECAEDVLDALLGMAEEHLGTVTEEQGVLDVCVAGGHRTFGYYGVDLLPKPGVGFGVTGSTGNDIGMLYSYLSRG